MCVGETEEGETCSVCEEKKCPEFGPDFSLEVVILHFGDEFFGLLEREAIYCCLWRDRSRFIESIYVVVLENVHKCNATVNCVRKGLTM